MMEDLGSPSSSYPLYGRFSVYDIVDYTRSLSGDIQESPTPVLTFTSLALGLDIAASASSALTASLPSLPSCSLPTSSLTSFPRKSPPQHS